MNEPDHYATSRAWSWRHAVGKSGLPPITRLVLHTLGLKMDATGGSCYPPVSELVDLTGLDKKTVLKHLEIAEEKGWIEVTQHGFRGQKWKRNEYVARWPGRDLTGEQATTFVSEGGAVPPPSETKVVEMVPEGGGNGSMKVVEELHQDKILPANIPANSPTAGAEEGVLRRADRKKMERDFTLWFASWKKGDVDFARNAWFALSDEERTECIERTPAYLRWAKPSDLMAAAVYLKNRHWRDVPEEIVTAPARGIAKVCGKLWMGTRLRALSQEPKGRIVLTTFDEKCIRDGEVSREALLHHKRMEHGWPLVTTMRDLARRKEPFVTSLVLLPYVADFRQVHRDSELFAAWADLHERRGWPFIEHPPEYVWLPAAPDGADSPGEAAEEALLKFLSAISEADNDDAA
ncbi:helix-turn-helix protein [Neorhizobium sp. R1-B]|uniref:helix-turn-helix domain-containing protein n=1 Tax=Neorhizobium sp. R1-B TaxID=2485162 RepID=UPI0010EBF6DC|nr:helix-turn-helix domain-containing protein [Neorhizobium sp. R1-B]TDX72612.1 helix-turn-helix protein [Neorhizobium sp. R1-B]